MCNYLPLTMTPSIDGVIRCEFGLPCDIGEDEIKVHVGREDECGVCLYDKRLGWMTEQGKFLWRRWHSIHVSIVCRREWGMRDGWWMARNQLTPSNPTAFGRSGSDSDMRVGCGVRREG